MVPPGRGEQEVRSRLLRVYRHQVYRRLRQRAGRPDMDIPCIHRNGRDEAGGRGDSPREHLHRVHTRYHGERPEAGARGAEYRYLPN